MSEVKLLPITEEEFVVWRLESENQYRDEIFRNGATLEEAKKKASDDFEKYLPLGRQTSDQFIFSVTAGGILVGTLWFGIRGAEDNRKAFIYDIALLENARGKGFGKQAMLLLEDEVKKIGLRHIGLHVFGHNTIARNLYTSLGYDITNLNMEKVLQ